MATAMWTATFKYIVRNKIDFRQRKKYILFFCHGTRGSFAEKSEKVGPRECIGLELT